MPTPFVPAGMGLLPPSAAGSMAAAAAACSFAPLLCRKSLELDARQSQQQGSELPRELLLLRFGAEAERKRREKRQQKVEAEMAECTFAPKLVTGAAGPRRDPSRHVQLAATPSSARFADAATDAADAGAWPAGRRGSGGPGFGRVGSALGDTGDGDAGEGGFGDGGDDDEAEEVGDGFGGGAIGRARRIAQLYALHEARLTQRRTEAERLRAARQQEEMKECTFRPRLVTGRRPATAPSDGAGTEVGGEAAPSSASSVRSRGIGGGGGAGGRAPGGAPRGFSQFLERCRKGERQRGDLEKRRELLARGGVNPAAVERNERGITVVRPFRLKSGEPRVRPLAGAGDAAEDHRGDARVDYGRAGEEDGSEAEEEEADAEEDEEELGPGEDGFVEAAAAGRSYSRSPPRARSADRPFEPVAPWSPTTGSGSTGSALRPKTPPRPESARGPPLVFVDLQLSASGSERIPLWRTTDVAQLATELATRHRLPDAMRVRLQSLLAQELELARGGQTE